MKKIHLKLILSQFRLIAVIMLGMTFLASCLSSEDSAVGDLTAFGFASCPEEGVALTVSVADPAFADGMLAVSWIEPTLQGVPEGQETSVLVLSITTPTSGVNTAGLRNGADFSFDTTDGAVTTYTVTYTATRTIANPLGGLIAQVDTCEFGIRILAVGDAVPPTLTACGTDSVILSVAIPPFFMPNVGADEFLFSSIAVRLASLSAQVVDNFDPSPVVNVVVMPNGAVLGEVDVVGLANAEINELATLPGGLPVGEYDIYITITDASDNSITCRADVTVNEAIDSEPPVYVGCPDNAPLLLPVGTAGTSREVSWNPPTVDDDVTAIGLPVVTATGATPTSQTIATDGIVTLTGDNGLTSYTVTVTYAALADAAGNVDPAAICEFTIAVEEGIDKEEPMLADQGDCSDQFEFFVQGGVTARTFSWNLPTYVDNAGPAGIVVAIDGDGVVSGTGVSTADFPLGTTTLTYSATDEAGNTDATQNCVITVVVIEDGAAPVAGTDCPVDVLVQTEDALVDASSLVSITSAIVNPAKNMVAVDWIVPTFTDDISGIASFGVSSSDGQAIASDATNADFPIGETTVTYTVVDNAGNSVVCDFTVSLEDNTLPVVGIPVVGIPIAGLPIVPSEGACPNVSEEVVFGEAGKLISFIEPTATDNSGLASLVERTHAPATFFEVGSTEVTYSFKDSAGNAASCAFNVIVIELPDAIPPVLVGCLDHNAVIDLRFEQGAAVAAEVARSINDALYAASLPLSGVITAQDNNPASLTPEVTLSVQSDGLVDQVTSLDFFAPSTPEGLYTLTYTATDAVELSSTCVFTITVDHTPPELSVCPTANAFPTNPVVGEEYTWAGASVLNSATDSSGSDVTVFVAVENVEENAIGKYSEFHAAVGGETFDAGWLSGTFTGPGTYTVTFSGNDLAWNLFECESFEITVIPAKTIQLVGCPDVNAATHLGFAKGSGVATELAHSINQVPHPAHPRSGAITATTENPDNPSPDVTLSVQFNSPTGLVEQATNLDFFEPVATEGDYTLVYTATDDFQRSVSCSFTVTVDHTPPTLSVCPTANAFPARPIVGEEYTWSGASTLTHAVDNTGSDVTVFVAVTKSDGGSGRYSEINAAVSSVGFDAGWLSGEFTAPGTYRVAFSANDLARNLFECESFEITVITPKTIQLVGCPDVNAATHLGFAKGSGVATELAHSINQVRDPALPLSGVITATTENPNNLSPEVTVSILSNGPSGLVEQATDIGFFGEATPEGGYTLVYTATDDFDRSVSCSFTVTVDHTPPTLSVCPTASAFPARPIVGEEYTWSGASTLTHAVDNTGSDVTVFVAVTKSDGESGRYSEINAAVSSVGFDAGWLSGEFTAPGTYRVAFSANDLARNLFECESFEITVITPKTIQLVGCPDVNAATHLGFAKGSGVATELAHSINQVLHPALPLSGVITATTENPNNLSPEVTVSILSNGPSGLVEQATDIGFFGEATPEGGYTLIYTATDDFDRSVSCSFTVTVDHTPPELSVCPPASAFPAYLVVEEEYTWSGASTLTRAVDDTGSDVTVFVLVENADTGSGRYVEIEAAVGGKFFEAGTLSGKFTEPGTYTVAFSATDSAGNRFSCPRFGIVVAAAKTIRLVGCPNSNDAELRSLKGSSVATEVARVINASNPATPGSGIITATNGNPENRNPVVTLSAQSNSPNSPVTEVANLGFFETAADGEYALTYTATDAFARSVSCSFTLTVDNTPPTIISGCPTASDYPIRPIAGELYTWTGSINIQAKDVVADRGDESVYILVSASNGPGRYSEHEVFANSEYFEDSETIISGTFSEPGTYTIAFFAQDEASNQTFCPSFELTVVPVMTLELVGCPRVNGVTDLRPQTGTRVASSLAWMINSAAPTIPSRTVISATTDNPANPNPAVTLSIQSNSSSGLVDKAMNLEAADLSFFDEETPEGDYTLTYTATDDFDRSLTCGFTFWVDQTPPVLSVCPVASDFSAAPVAREEYTWTGATNLVSATDNYLDFSVSVTVFVTRVSSGSGRYIETNAAIAGPALDATWLSGEFTEPGTYSVAFTGADWAGNRFSCPSFEISVEEGDATVVDVIAIPELECPAGPNTVEFNTVTNWVDADGNDFVVSLPDRTVTVSAFEARLSRDVIFADMESEPGFAATPSTVSIGNFYSESPTAEYRVTFMTRDHRGLEVDSCSLTFSSVARQ